MCLKEIIDVLNGNTRRRNRTRVVVCTTIGVLIGAAAGILLAPKSGSETRKDIKQGAEWTAEKASKAARKAAKYIKEEAAAVNETVTEKMNDLKTKIKNAKDTPNETSEKPVEEKNSK